MNYTCAQGQKWGCLVSRRRNEVSDQHEVTLAAAVGESELPSSRPPPGGGPPGAAAGAVRLFPRRAGDSTLHLLGSRTACVPFLLRKPGYGRTGVGVPTVPEASNQEPREAQSRSFWMTGGQGPHAARLATRPEET